jgi:hypothetical protein
MTRRLRPLSPARLASGPGPARLALALGALALLAVAPAPAAAKAKPIVALAPVEILLDGHRELVGVAVAPDGTAYVSDRKAGSIWRLAPAGQLTLAAAGLRRPAGLALDADRRLLIAEQQTGRVLRLERAGTLSVRATGLKQPRWLALAPDGTLYISAQGLRLLADRDEDDEDDKDADNDGPRIIVRRAPGTGALSVVASGLRQLQAVAVNGHTLYAALKRVVGLAPVDGAVARFPLLPGGGLGAPSYLLSAGVKRPVGLALDRLGALYVTAPEVGRRGHKAKDAVGKIHPDGHLTEFARELEDPQGAALGPDGSLYVADGHGGRLIRFRAPPAPTFTGLPEFTKLSSLTVTGTAQAHARVDVFVNDATTPTSVTATGGGAFTVIVALAPNAANTLEAFATAHGGLTSAATEATVTHDDIAPALTFQAPPEGTHVRQLVAIQAEASDDGSGIAQLILSAGMQPLTATFVPPPPAGTVTASATWDTTKFGAGAVGLTATATDQAGNTATLTRSVIVDNTPPVITLTAGPAEGAVTPASVTFVFMVSDNLTDPSDLMVTLRLDDVLLAGATSPVTLPLLVAGPHTFTISARDRAGNEATLTRGFTVSLGPAITSLDPPSGPAGTFVTITGASLVASPTQVTFNGVPAVVRSASPTSLTTTVPIGATTGPVTVTTTRGSASQTFTVTTTGDFTLTAASTTVRAIAGDQTSVNIAAGGSGSFTSLVSLTLPTPPSGISASFSPSQFVAPGASAFVNLVIATSVAPGSYNFTVTGQAQVDGRTVTRTTAFTLEILAPDTPALTGRVLTADALPQPIPGVTVTLGSAFTLTDAGGNFVLLAPPPGANMLLVDGRTASTPTVQYPPVEVNIAVGASGPTRVPFIVYLPKLDTANPVTLPLDPGGFTTQEVKASTPVIPGLVVTIPAGTRIIGPDGTPVSQITITPVPVDRSPMPFPPGVTIPMLFTIQPGGAVPSQPLPISFPNVQQAPPGMWPTSTSSIWSPGPGPSGARHGEPGWDPDRQRPGLWLASVCLARHRAADLTLGRSALAAGRSRDGRRARRSPHRALHGQQDGSGPAGPNPGDDPALLPQ